MSLIKRTVLVVEFDTVQGKDLCEQLCLCLGLGVLEGIPVDEIALALRVGVEVHVKTQGALLGVV